MRLETDAPLGPVHDDGCMPSTPRIRTAAAVPLAAALVLVTLTGCADIQDAVQRQASGEFATRAELVQDWKKQAPWLPADAQSIITRESTITDEASLTTLSDADLDPAQCAEVERRSAPLFTLEHAPDVYKIERAFACGDWSVVATDDGWYGWTPNHPAEKAQSPAS